MRTTKVTADGAVVSFNRLFGYSFRETSGAAAALVVIRDGDDATAEPVIFISLAANESTRDYFADGLKFESGIFVDVVSGAVEGSVWS